jgi:hypothetical protein
MIVSGVNNKMRSNNVEERLERVAKSSGEGVDNVSNIAEDDFVMVYVFFLILLIFLLILILDILKILLILPGLKFSLTKGLFVKEKNYVLDNLLNRVLY